MSLIVDIVDYVDAQTSLTIDVDLFVGGETPSATEKSVVVRETPSSFQTWSGMQTRAVQFLIKELSYVAAETLANQIFDLFAHKPGLSSGSVAQGVFYVDVINRPALLDRDERGACLFVFNLIFRKS